MSYATEVGPIQKQEFSNCFLSATASHGHWLKWDTDVTAAATASFGLIASKAKDAYAAHLCAGVLWNRQLTVGTQSTYQLIITGGFVDSAWCAVGNAVKASAGNIVPGSPLLGAPWPHATVANANDGYSHNRQLAGIPTDVEIRFAPVHGVSFGNLTEANATGTVPAFVRTMW